MTINDYYIQLFGKIAIQDGNVIDMAEHGRVGGVSTGQGVKYVQVLDSAGDVVSSFGSSGSGLATVTVIQGTTPWLVTMATQSIIGYQGGTWTVQPGNTPNTTAWLVTMASISGKFTGWGGSLSAFQGGNWSMGAVGGSLTAYQGSAPWLMTMATQSVISYQGGSWSHAGIGGSISAFQGGSWNMAAIGGSLSAAQLGTWTVQPGNTPNTTAWLMTLATLPVFASQAGTWAIASLPTLSVYQGTNPWTVAQKSSSALTTLVSGATGSTVLLLNNASRIAASIYNDSTSILYVKFGTGATSSSYKTPLNASTYYEIPGGYTGIISGFWATLTGSARISEET